MDFNVPMIIKIQDSLGNVIDTAQIRRDSVGNGSVVLNKEQSKDLRPGEVLRIEIEVDPSFEKEDYEINWSGIGITAGNNSAVLVLNIKEEHVAQMFHIGVTVKSVKNNWHRMPASQIDDYVAIYYRILPPIQF